MPVRSSHWLSPMKGGCMKRSRVEQLILDETTWGNPHYSPFYFLYTLQRGQGLERRVDEGLNLFEIVSVALWIMLDFPGSNKNWGLNSESSKEAFASLPCKAGSVEDWFSQGRGSTSRMHSWLNVLWLGAAIICEWVIHFLAVEMATWIWPEAMSRASKYRKKSYPNWSLEICLTQCFPPS